MKFEFFEPDTNPIKTSKEKLIREMLREAIAIIVLETDAKSENAVRSKIRRRALKRLKRNEKN